MPNATVRPVTADLVESIKLDLWPRPSAICDFGLDAGVAFGKPSQKHYEAIYHPLRKGEITPEQLDDALGSGPKLTALVNAAPSNPHKGIVFQTMYDDMPSEPDENDDVL